MLIEALAYARQQTQSLPRSAFSSVHTAQAKAADGITTLMNKVEMLYPRRETVIR